MANDDGTEDEEVQATVHFIVVDPPRKSQAGSNRAAKRHTARSNWQKYRSATAKTNRRQGEAAAPSVPDRHPTSSSLPRSISSPFGAVDSETFALSPPGVVSLVTTHCLKVIWPDLLYDRNAARTWLAAFSEHPILFHGFHYAAAVHADTIRGQNLLSLRADMLWHKNMTLKALRKLLIRLQTSDGDLEIAIHAVLLLASNDLSDKEFDLQEATSSQVIPISPHLPTAGWTQVFGKLVSHDDHAKILSLLVKRAGGLTHLAFPGLSGVIALADLIAASLQLSCPQFPCHWPSERDWSPLVGFLQPEWWNWTGVGFAEGLGTTVPREKITIFTDLAVVDMMMTRCRQRRLNVEDHRTVVYSRNAAQHSLLSLQVDAGQDDDLSGLRLCKTASLLYANSVLFPLPLDRPWRSILLQQLCDGLATFSPLSQHDDEHDRQELYAWAACVGALISVNTRHEKTVLLFLRRMLYRLDVKSLRGLQRLLTKFLWSPQACDAGLGGIWNSIQDVII